MIGPRRTHKIALASLLKLVLYGFGERRLLSCWRRPAVEGNCARIVGAILEEDRRQIVGGILTANEVGQAPLVLATDRQSSNRAMGR